MKISLLEPSRVPEVPRLFIGTSGWHYKHWRKTFYPASLTSAEYLPYYARHFASVELNNSFYKLPTLESFALWRESVPEGFVFAVKGSRFITHMKKLKLSEGQGILPLLERVPALGDKLGPILFQLPPRWHLNLERLETFLAALPPWFRYAFELRDPTWFDDRVYELLARYNAAFCIYEISGRESPWILTADWLYIRLHGPEMAAYQGLYGPAGLARWAEAIANWHAEGRSVYCYFDNDQAAYAVQDALLLQDMLAESVPLARQAREW